MYVFAKVVLLLALKYTKVKQFIVDIVGYSRMRNYWLMLVYNKSNYQYPTIWPETCRSLFILAVFYYKPNNSERISSLIIFNVKIDCYIKRYAFDLEIYDKTN